ncbi:MAG: chorismate-binding protein [Eubacteriales bacterium]|nr:chorismate-binding protein [Eubacteriales bacterium]
MKRIRRAYSKTVSIIEETAPEIYRNYVGDGKGFLLESYDKNYDRYVFMGREPEEIIQTEKDRLLIRGRDGDIEVMEGDPVKRLEEYYREFEIVPGGVQLPFSGGLVGAFGYDFVRYWEELPDDNPDEIGIDTIQLMLVTEFLSIDHVAETMTAVVLEEENEEGQQRAQLLMEKMIKEALEKKQMSRPKRFQPDGVVVKQSDTLEQYCEKVEKIKKYIVDGHVFQTVLSQRWTVETRQNGFDLYEELRGINPSPYMYYFNFGDFEIIGSSPEMIAKHRDGLITTCPIAGTRPRGKNEEEDIRMEKSLYDDPKEKAEHVMLVDLARNDMGRTAEFGSVKVKDFMHIQKYSHVMHLVSFVEGRKRADLNPMDLLGSFLPAGTLSGAPKVRAMEIIDELEEVRRGLYGGAVGYIDFGGNMDFCITIRTMIKKGNRVYLQAGAGIVADSNPVGEYKECCNKVRALAKVLVREENL